MGGPGPWPMSVRVYPRVRVGSGTFFTGTGLIDKPLYDQERRKIYYAF